MFERGPPRARDPVRAVAVVYSALLLTWATAALAGPESWRYEWPNTAFSKHSVELDEILSGGPPKDGIPSIDRPEFVAVGETTNLAGEQPALLNELKEAWLRYAAEVGVVVPK